jgi:hypothetical protein
MTWVLDELKGKKNPAGRGNGATFDGSPLRNTFYMKGLVEGVDAPEAVYETWKRAYAEGHEIGNHTWRHVAIDPDNEIRRCDSTLDSIGIPKSEIHGFRTPQLAVVVEVLNAVFKRGFLYDCTLEHHTGIAEGQFVWPYTLENGWHESAYGALSMSFPGMWEMPVYQFASGATGFDYNAWTAGASGADFLNTLKSSLDFHMSTNRAPFFIGAHTDYYATNNEYFDGEAKASYTERRKAIADFIAYALSKPDVRIVRFVDVIRWMRNPVALDGPIVLTLPKAVRSPGSYKAMNQSGNRILLSIPRDGFAPLNQYLATGRNAGSAVTIPR